MQISPVVITELLGRGTRPISELDLADEVEKGLPLSALDRIAREVVPDDSSFIFRLVPRATLARRRRQKGARLTSEESARVARVASVWAFAKKVWGGDENSARRWLFKPHMMLEDRRPIDIVLASEFGRPVVEGVLGRLYYGVAV